MEMTNLKPEQVLDYITTRRWLYAAATGVNNKLITFHYDANGRYFVEESEGYQRRSTTLYQGDDLTKAIDVYNGYTNVDEEPWSEEVEG
jgi:hypothetical protein